MFLKKIQLFGFKSFADKITVPFDRGITGIVGPNGSGKSNIIDAVRWVMGEQSAKNLRGKVATDIIFSGSTSRKPVGFAEVSLVFDNSQESAFCPPEYRFEPEISLTRRLYADGQREFLINKKPCRLKDMLNFFINSGLGSRSYSMIQQGQVDRILNAKPEDVRIILEEAAGTLSFKIRRDEALKKLTQTRENLSRVEDILNELLRQQHALQGQLEKAQKWQELSARLKSEELSLFAHNFYFLNEELLGISQFTREQVDQEAAFLAESTQLEARHLALQNELNKKDPEFEAMHEEIAMIREQIAREESIISGTDARVDDAKKRVEQIENEIFEDSENLKVVEEQFQLTSSEHAIAKKESEDIQAQIESFQDQVDAVERDAQGFTTQIEDFEDELRNIDRLLESNALRSEAINREKNKLAQEIETQDERKLVLEKECREFTEQLAVREGAVNEKKQGLSADIDNKAKIDVDLRNREILLQEHKQKHDVLKEDYLTKRAQLNSLKDFEQSASDIYGAVKEITRELGIDGDEDDSDSPVSILTDKIAFSARAKELGKQARAAFEKWAERLLVKDIDTLNAVVRLTHKLELGNLPVLLASSAADLDKQRIAAWQEETEAEPIESFLKIGKEQSALKPILQCLYFLPDINLSAKEVESIPAGLIVFTAQGVILGGNMECTVISGKTNAGVLSRKEEAEQLAAALKEAENGLAESQTKIDKLELLQSQDRLTGKEIDQKLQELNTEVVQQVSDLQNTKQLLNHKQDLLKNNQSQLAQLTKDLQSLNNELAEQGQDRIALGEEQERISSELASLQEEASSIDEKRAEVFRQHDQRKLKQAKAEAKAQALHQSYVQTQAQVERLQSALSRRYAEKEKLLAEIEQIKQSHSNALLEIEQLLAKREKLETDLAVRKEENSGLINELRHLDNQLKTTRDKLNALQKTLNQKTLDKERLESALQNIMQQATEKYHLDIKEYSFEREEEFNSTKKTREVQKLRQNIEDLGAINMMAIEEYGQLSERLEFIQAQKIEIVNSISVLEEALEEVELTTKIKFVETYTTINQEFVNLFPILFPGGEARLELTAPDDPLNCGVEILARLPGKKLQRMTLLSGGEKALTAISLIFALLKTKPTPYCFLDEVDAPLDEANVGRFNRVIETLSERFQFIIITHNRRTMEVLDTLYGVTMQEPGVSKVVGVDMNKDLPKHLQKAFRDERNIEGASAS